MNKQFLHSKDQEIRELKRMIPGSKQYKKKFQKLKAQAVPNVFKDFKQSSKGDEVYWYKRKHRIRLLLSLVCILVAVVLLVFSVLSLGDKELQDFTSAEMQQFILWMSSISVSLSAAMLFAIHAGGYISQYLVAVIDNYDEDRS